MKFNPELNLQLKALQLRNYILKQYKKHGITDQQHAVLAALTLGYKNKLDEEIKHAYSNSGGMHVLAVSGLHVGIIYLVLAFLLKPLRKRKYGNYLAVSIVITFLWFYALLTGLSPSVFRASTMFTIIAIGTLFKRNTNIYNSLAASALILLLYNPCLITEIGFQLSYLAVIGIVFFYPKIYGILHIKNKLVDNIWSLTAVSLAAQIATFPISLYYFQQFPSYFLLTNFLVIPFATILIYGTILFLLLSFIQPLAYFFAKLLNYLVYGLNTAVQFIESLPGSVIENINSSFMLMLLLYILIVFIAFLIAYKNKKYIFFIYTTVILIAIDVNYEKFKVNMKEHFIVFNIPGNSFTQIKSKTSTHNIYGSKDETSNYTIVNNTNKFQQEKHYILEQSSKHPIFKKNIFVFNNESILFENHARLNQFKNVDSKLKIDYLVLSNKTKNNLFTLLQFYDIKNVIIDASVSFFSQKRWIEACKKNEIPYHSTREKGAFILEL